MGMVEEGMEVQEETLIHEKKRKSKGLTQLTHRRAQQEKQKHQNTPSSWWVNI